MTEERLCPECRHPVAQHNAKRGCTVFRPVVERQCLCYLTPKEIRAVVANCAEVDAAMQPVFGTARRSPGPPEET